jgi:RNA recognition motif-containing protein
LAFDRRTGVANGTANVTFENEKDAEEAMFHLDGGQVDGKQIKVVYILVSNNKRRRDPSGTHAFIPPDFFHSPNMN